MSPASSACSLRLKLLYNGYARGVVNYNMNGVLQKQQNKPLTPTMTVPKKKIFLVLLYLGLQSKIFSKQIMFKALINGHHTSALADHVTSTGHSLNWDHFEVLTKGRSDTHCKIKETLLIKDLKPTLDEYVSGEKLCLY